MNYSTVFDLIAEAAQKAGARLILIGGFAVNAYHYARNTKDVDFLTTDEDYPKIARFLSLSGFRESVKTDVFVKQVFENAEGMPIDFLFVDPDTFESIWKDGTETVLSGKIFRMPSLFHLIALKLHAIKQGSKDRAWKDIPDILNLIEANRIDIRSFDFVEVCRKYGPKGIYEDILKMCTGDKKKDG